MRREPFVTVLLASLVALAGTASSQGQEAASRPAKKGIAKPCHARGGPSHARPGVLASDTVSGCVRGAPLVKVLIDLRKQERRCVPVVLPGSVCVAPGGVVRFKLQSECKLVGKEIEITAPRWDRPLHDGQPVRPEKPPILGNCSRRFPRPGAETGNVIHCDVPADAVPGFYIYEITGVEGADPDIEIRPGDG